MKWTIFQSPFDNKTHRFQDFDTWDSMCGLLEKLSKLPGSKGGDNSSALISPAIYEEGTTRSNKNVTEWGGWAALDVDDFKPTMPLEEELEQLIGKWEFVAYSTATSSFDQPKFRLLFPLTDNVPRDDIPHFWYALQKEFGDIGDEQTKDMSRMYYVPADYPTATFQFFFRNRGEIIDPYEIMAKHRYVPKHPKTFIDLLPPHMQEAAIAARKAQAEQTGIKWTSYKDCQLWPTNLENKYKSISEAGWYGMMYKIMVGIACNAVRKNYPITANEISQLCREFDRDTGNWYETRPFELEANSAIQFAYRNATLDIDNDF